MNLQTETTRNCARNAKDIMDANIMDQYGVTELAEVVGVQRSHLTRRFVIEYGITPSAYARNLAKNKIVELVKEKNHSTSYIGDLLGMGRHKVMILFKASEGIGINEYLRGCDT